MNMEDLKIECDFRKGDSLEIETGSTERGEELNVIVRCSGHFFDVLLGKEKARQLHEWLGRYLEGCDSHPTTQAKD